MFARVAYVVLVYISAYRLILHLSSSEAASVSPLLTRAITNRLPQVDDLDAVPSSQRSEARRSLQTYFKVMKGGKNEPFVVLTKTAFEAKDGPMSVEGEEGESIPIPDDGWSMKENNFVDHVSSDAQSMHLSISGGPEIGLMCSEVYFNDVIDVYVNFNLRYVCYFNDDTDQGGHIITIIIDGLSHRIAQGSNMVCNRHWP